MPRMVFGDVVGVIALSLLLFWPAGTLAWPQAWTFLFLCCGCSIVLGVWLKRADPALLAERRRSPFAGDQRPQDRAIMGALLLCGCGWLVMIGVDAGRFHWSPTPLWLQGLGAALIVAAFLGWVTVLSANSFAVSTIRLQPERGQTVVSTGPYAVVRHPMYAVGLMLLVGTPLLLGSLWGLLGVPVLLILLGARAIAEEALLTEGLPGYRDYVTKVRFRLVPGVW